MKTRNLLMSFGAVFCLSFFVASCEKKNDEVSKTDAIAVASDDAIASDMFDDAYSESEDVSIEMEKNNFTPDHKKSTSLQGSRVITVNHSDTSTFPKTITVTYTNWTAPNGRVKNGTLSFTINKRWMRAGYVRTLTFENFTVNGYLIEGTKTVSYQGLVGGKPSFSISLKNGKVTTPDGKIIEHEYTRTRSWESGFNTPLFIWDDVWFVSGSGSGINRNGYAYTLTIKEPLQFRVGCPWAKAGVIEVVVEENTTVSIDFGDGTCDRKFTITIHGESVEKDLVEGSETAM